MKKWSMLAYFKRKIMCNATILSTQTKTGPQYYYITYYNTILTMLFELFLYKFFYIHFFFVNVPLINLQGHIF